MDISKNIKAIRELSKISQSEIARRLGVEPTNYPRMEKRGNKLTVEQLEKIAGALGVSVIELMTGEPQKVEDTDKVKELEKQVRELEKKNEELRKQQDDFWLSAMALIHASIFDKGIAMGLLKEDERLKGVLDYLKDVLGSNIRFRETRVLTLSILDAFPPDKINAILEELFKLEWFRILSMHLPFDEKMRNTYRIWFYENEEHLQKIASERLFKH